MSEMIERVARAVFDKISAQRLIRIGAGYTREDALDVARAAIEAMREPSEEGFAAVLDANGYPGIPIVKRIWVTMIDKALK